MNIKIDLSKSLLSPQESKAHHQMSGGRKVGRRKQAVNRKVNRMESKSQCFLEGNCQNQPKKRGIDLGEVGIYPMSCVRSR